MRVRILKDHVYARAVLVVGEVVDLPDHIAHQKIASGKAQAVSPGASTPSESLPPETDPKESAPADLRTTVIEPTNQDPKIRSKRK